MTAANAKNANTITNFDLETNLLTLIKKHDFIMNEALKCSEKILESAISQNLTQLMAHTDNREKVLNILKDLQNQIEEKVNHLNKNSIGQEFLEKLVAWKNAFINLVQTIGEYDQKIIETLTMEKNKISQDVAQLFTGKEKIKGYSSQNLKRP